MTICCSVSMPTSRVPSRTRCCRPCPRRCDRLSRPARHDSTRYLVLTWPDGTDGFHVGLSEPVGNDVYYGHHNGSEIADGPATFPLFELDSPGVTPIALSVVATLSGVSLRRQPGGVDTVSDRSARARGD
jgi:hypothetical protein